MLAPQRVASTMGQLGAHWLAEVNSQIKGQTQYQDVTLSPEEFPIWRWTNHKIVLSRQWGQYTLPKTLLKRKHISAQQGWYTSTTQNNGKFKKITISQLTKNAHKCVKFCHINCQQLLIIFLYDLTGTQFLYPALKVETVFPLYITRVTGTVDWVHRVL